MSYDLIFDHHLYPKFIVKHNFNHQMVDTSPIIALPIHCISFKFKTKEKLKKYNTIL